MTQDEHVLAWLAWCEENAGEWPTSPQFMQPRYTGDLEEEARILKWIEELEREGQ